MAVPQGLPIPQGTWENWYRNNRERNLCYHRLSPEDYPALGYIPQGFRTLSRNDGVDLLNFDPANLLPEDASESYETSEITTPTQLRTTANARVRTKPHGRPKEEEVAIISPYGKADFMTGASEGMNVAHINAFGMSIQEGHRIDKMRGTKPGTFRPCKRTNLVNALAGTNLDQRRNGYAYLPVLSPNNLRLIPALMAAIKHNLNNETQPKDRVDLRRVFPALYGNGGYFAVGFPLVRRSGSELTLFDPTTGRLLHNQGPDYPPLHCKNGVIFVTAVEPELLLFSSAAALFHHESNCPPNEPFVPQPAFNEWQDSLLDDLRKTFEGCFGKDKTVKVDTVAEWNRSLGEREAVEDNAHAAPNVADQANVLVPPMVNDTNNTPSTQSEQSADQTELKTPIRNGPIRQQEELFDSSDDAGSPINDGLIATFGSDSDEYEDGTPTPHQLRRATTPIASELEDDLGTPPPNPSEQATDVAESEDEAPSERVPVRRSKRNIGNNAPAVESTDVSGGKDGPTRTRKTIARKKQPDVEPATADDGEEDAAPVRKTRTRKKRGQVAEDEGEEEEDDPPDQAAAKRVPKPRNTRKKKPVETFNDSEDDDAAANARGRPKPRPHRTQSTQAVEASNNNDQDAQPVRRNPTRAATKMRDEPEDTGGGRKVVKLRTKKAAARTTAATEQTNAVAGPGPTTTALQGKKRSYTSSEAQNDELPKQKKAKER